jgi:hypothetical protein
VLAATIPVVGLAGVTVPGADARTAAWLLPAFALTTVSLALAPLLGPVRAAVLVGAAWTVLILATAVPDRAYALPFSGGGQVGSAVLGLCAAGLLLLQRHRFDSGDTGIMRRTR